ncbi:hypothetical protein J1G42_03920 [Cellulomonas sp. zg-ZUI222]|uniref:hypothetical protein n=1 Tax=Cellulomonas TaxID=1707 RepID=UPI001A94D1DD|nr:MULTISPECIES: hypothetical protein [Cellulomonas]MBO0899116.1 hypothetical protein [Cellulomonas sp. zg-ZUI22]MBO0919969.1 hypothetical protein [Cellulomonas wangleii]
MNPSTTSRPRRKRLVVAGAIAASLSVAGAGAAVAASNATGPEGTTAAAVHEDPAVVTEADAPAPVAVTDAPAAAPSADDEWAAMPDGYTREQYEALWSSGYTPEDINALGELWQIEGTELKARIGQAVLDGEQLPVAPGSTPQDPAVAQFAAVWEAGYTAEDIEALNALWGTDWAETKARAGQAILDGQPLPVAPGSSPAS